MKRRRPKHDVVDIGDLRHTISEVTNCIRLRGSLGIHEKQHQEAPFGPFLHTDLQVTSSNAGSCPVTITLFDEPSSAGCVTIGFGCDYEEFWNLPRHKVLASMVPLLEGIMQGHYVEWRKSDSEVEECCGVVTSQEGVILYDSRGRITEEGLRRKGYERRAFNPY